MQFNLEILSITGPIKNQKGQKSWNVFEVAYKKDGKIEGKKVIDFANPDVFKLVGQAKQGEVYTVTSEKINDFWQWTGFDKAGTGTEVPSISGGASSAGQPSVPVKSTGSTTSRVTGSNYETAEERVVKQRFIIRQSSISNALEFFKMAGLKKENPQDVLDLAEKFVEFVYKQPGMAESIAEMSDDIPY